MLYFKNNRLFLFTIPIIVLGVIFILALLIGYNKPTSFNVISQTELITIKVIGSQNPRIPIHNMFMFKDDTSKESTLFTGSIEVSDSCTIQVQRELKGDLSIRISRIKGGVGVLYNEFEEIKEVHSNNYIEFFKPKDSIESKTWRNYNTIIPIFGLVSIGRPIYYETLSSPTAISKSGVVNMISSTLFGSKYFQSGSRELNIGDYFYIDEENSNKKAYGFILINTEPGMQANYRMLGKRGYIGIAGPSENDQTKSYFIESSLANRITYDPFFKVLGWFGTFIIILNALISTIQQIRLRF